MEEKGREGTYIYPCPTGVFFDTSTRTVKRVIALLFLLAQCDMILPLWERGAAWYGIQHDMVGCARGNTDGENTKKCLNIMAKLLGKKKTMALAYVEYVGMPFAYPPLPSCLLQLSAALGRKANVLFYLLHGGNRQLLRPVHPEHAKLHKPSLAFSKYPTPVECTQHAVQPRHWTLFRMPNQTSSVTKRGMAPR